MESICHKSEDVDIFHLIANNTCNFDTLKLDVLPDIKYIHWYHSFWNKIALRHKTRPVPFFENENQFEYVECQFGAKLSKIVCSTTQVRGTYRVDSSTTNSD